MNAVIILICVIMVWKVLTYGRTYRGWGESTFDDHYSRESHDADVLAGKRPRNEREDS